MFSVTELKPKKRLPNKLKDVRVAEPRLFVSAWATSTDDTLRWSNTQFVQGPNLQLTDDLWLPVKLDRATANYVRSRNMAYVWEQYLAESTDGKPEWRIRITDIEFDSSSGDETRVDLEWDDFFQRYVGNARPFRFDDELEIARVGPHMPS